MKKPDSNQLPLTTTTMDGGSVGFAGAINRPIPILGQAPRIMKRLLGAVPLILLTLAMPLMGAAPVIRSMPPQAQSQMKAMSVDDRLQLMERRVQALTDILIRLDRIQREVQQLRGDMELQNYTLEALKKRQRDLYGDIDRRMMQLASQQPPSRSSPSYPASGDTPVGVSPGVSQGQIAAVTPPVSASSGVGLLTDAPATPQADPISQPFAAPVVPVEVPVIERPQLVPSPGAVIPAVQVPVVKTPAAVSPVLGEAISTLPPVATIPSQQVSGVVTPASVPTPPPADPALEQPLYKQAYELLKQRRYDEAKQAFRGFLVQYPRGDLAANAQYWVGETSYVLRDFTAAMTEFGKVVQHYPDSSKVPGALLKIAYIQFERKEWAASRKTLEEMVKKHPTTTAARLARDRLERMRIEGN